MHQSSTDKILAMWKLARYDPKCSAVGQKYDEMEETFAGFVAGLSKEEQDLVWGFVGISDELDFCVMELMCEVFDIDPVGYLERLEAGRKSEGDCHASVRTGSQ